MTVSRVRPYSLDMRMLARPYWLALAAIACACGDGGGVDPGAAADAAIAAPDAGEEPVLTACTPEGQPGNVTVETPTFRNDSSLVLVHDQDGTLLHIKSVEGKPDVIVVVPSCGMVTLATFPEFADRPHMVTWMDVQPRDRLGTPKPRSYFSAPVEVTFDPLPGAEEYQLVTTGDATSATVGPVVLDARTRDRDVSVLAVTSVAGAFAWAGGIAEVVPIDGGQVVLDPWRQDTVDVTMALTELPDDVTRVRGEVALVAGDDALSGPVATAAPVAGAVTLAPITIPDGFGEAQATVILEHGDIDFVSIARGPVSSTGTLRGSDFLPLPASFEITGTAPREIFTWSASAALPDTADLVILEAETGPDWVVIAPADATRVRLPEVPEEFLPPEPPRPDTVAVASIGDTADYRDALFRLGEINQLLFSPSVEPFRLSLAGDLDLLIIEVPR